jgi:hypothetical protein
MLRRSAVTLWRSAVTLRRSAVTLWRSAVTLRRRATGRTALGHAESASHLIEGYGAAERIHALMRGSEAATRRGTGRRRVATGRRAAARCVKSGRGRRGRRATEVRRACAVTRGCVRGRGARARCVRARALRRDRGRRCGRSVGWAGGRCARGGRKGETTRRRHPDHRPFKGLFLRRTCGWSCRTRRRCRGGRCNRCGWRCRWRLRLSRLVHHEHRPLELRGRCSSNVESALRTGGGRFRVFRTAVRTEQGVPPGAGVRTPLATPTDAPLHATRKAASFSSFACLGRLLDALRSARPGVVPPGASRSFASRALVSPRSSASCPRRPSGISSDRFGARRPRRSSARRSAFSPSLRASENRRTLPPDYYLDTAAERPLGFARVAKGNIPRASRFVTPVTFRFLRPRPHAQKARLQGFSWPSSSPPNGNAR